MGPWGEQRFAYDANGNRTSMEISAEAAHRAGKTVKAATTYVYTANQLDTSTYNGQVRTFQYDAAGNTVSDGTFDLLYNFVYNQQNRLGTVESNGRTTAEYTYNAKGQRVVKKLTLKYDDKRGGSADYVIFHYDIAGRLMEESTASGKRIKDYVYLGANPLAMVEGRRNETFFYHDDQSGSPLAMTDGQRGIAWRAELDPFGKISGVRSIVGMTEAEDGGSIARTHKLYGRLYS